jgi:hypothetical protein
VGAASQAAELKPSAPAKLIKTGGHIHRMLLNEPAGEMYTAGHGKVEVWSWR